MGSVPVTGSHNLPAFGHSAVRLLRTSFSSSLLLKRQ
jgi:hypothetical protein